MRALALAVLAACFALTLVAGPWSDESVTDLFLYRAYGDLFLDGLAPYRDVTFEYPPLAALLLALPAVPGAGDGAYRLAFAALALGLASLLVLLVGALARRTGGDPRRAMLAAAGAPLLTGAMLRTHFDLAPVVLTLAALALVVSRRPRLGLAVLGLAVMTKGFPIVVAPVALAWLCARGRVREAADSALAMGVVVIAVGGIALALSPAGAVGAVTYHLERPAQVESAPALVLLGLDAAGAGRATVVHSHRSEGVEHPASTAVVAAFTVVLIAMIVLLSAGAARSSAAARAVGTVESDQAAARGLVLASLAAMAAFAAFGKVLSPQFLIWSVPLAALALSWSMPVPAVGAALALALTLLEFPAHYGDVVAREPATLWLVAARDAALAVTVLAAGRELALRAKPARVSARWRWRVRRGPPRPVPR